MLLPGIYRIDLNGKRGRVSLRRSHDWMEPDHPFTIHVKEYGQSVFTPRPGKFVPSLCGFLIKVLLVVGNEQNSFLPGGKRATNLKYEDVVDLWNQVQVAATLINPAFHEYLFKEAMKYRGHREIVERAETIK